MSGHDSPAKYCYKTRKPERARNGMVVYFATSGEILIFGSKDGGVLLKPGQSVGTTIMQDNGTRYDAQVTSLFPTFQLATKSFGNSDNWSVDTIWTVSIGNMTCQTTAFRAVISVPPSYKGKHKGNVWDETAGTCNLLPGRHAWPSSDSAWPSPAPK